MSTLSNFDAGARDLALERRRKQLTMRERGVGAYGGVGYGLSAFGYPLGSITGVGQGGAPPSSPPATEALGEQFGGAGDAGSGGDSGGSL